MFSSPDNAAKGRSYPLKVVVMSATLETDKLSAFLGGCPVFTIPGRTFPVTCTFGSAVGPKDTESTGYVKEVLSFSFEFAFLYCYRGNVKFRYVVVARCTLSAFIKFAPQVVRMALDVHTSEVAGDILVFLTGKS